MAIIANKDDDLKYKKKQIELFFSVHSDVQERAEYLRSAYQNRYTEIITDDGQRLGYKPQENGLLMWEGSYPSRTKESVFSWDIVTQWTAQLIDKKEYFIQTDIPRLPTQESQQMSLFDFAAFNQPAQAEGTAQPSIFPHPALPQQVIDEALCIGANDQNSRLIVCAYFKKDKPDNARFLAEHYGENGAGFYLYGRQYAIWYNAEGIRIAQGESAQRSSATLIPWEQAAARIRELLDLGRYMPQSELDRVDGYERQQRAAQLWYLDVYKRQAEGCIPISYEDDLHGKIVVRKPEGLRREYRRATRQLKLCMGGFGASPHSRGSACYCVDLYTGKESRYERMDVLGTIQPEDLPGWAKHCLLYTSRCV